MKLLYPLLASVLLLSLVANAADLSSKGRGEDYLSTPSKGYILPSVVHFTMDLIEGPDVQGVFTAFCQVESLLCDLPVGLRVAPSEGVEVVEMPERFEVFTWCYDRVIQGEVLRFRIRGRVLPRAPRPAGINVRLSYQYPIAEARLHVESGEGPYRDKYIRDLTLERLAEMKAEPRDATHLNRAVLIR